MARSPRRIFAAPFVVTALLAAPAAADHSSKDKIRFDGYQCLQGPADKEDSVPCPPNLLPKPKKGTAVYKDDSGECRIVGNKQVRCPPTITLPNPSSDSGIEFDNTNLSCVKIEDMHCPPDATCNPPPPQPIACPDNLLPHLVGHLKPTKRKGGCYLGTVKVACK